MSADNWAICPKCKLTAENAQAKAIAKAKASYGKVEPEEYIRAITVANAPVKLENTLREDYSIGIDESGLFEVHYTGSCKKCGMEFTYEDQKGVPA